MRIEIVTRREDLEALRGDWDALAAADPRDGFFRTFVWYRAWLEYIRPDAEPFVLVARDAAGTINGIAPLCRLAYRDLGFRVAAIAWGGREVVSGDFLDFVARPESRAAVTDAFVRHLATAPESSALLVMGELLEDGESLRALSAAAAANGLATRRQEERICPYIALPATFDDYLAGLGTSTRYHIRRRMRDVEKKGAAVQVYTRPEDIAARLDTLVRLHLARWQKDNQPGTFGRKGFTDLLKHVFVHPPAGVEWRLYEMVHDGRAAASLLTFYFGESALYYQAGWDPGSAVSALSPGVVLMAHSIRDAAQHGLRYYEFLRGDEAYKSRWTKTYRRTVTLLAARGAMARAYLQAARFKDTVKRTGLIGRVAPEPGAEQCADSQ